MPARSHAAASGRVPTATGPERWLTGLASAAFAVVLLACGSMLLAATLASVPASSVVRKLNRGMAATPTELEAMVAARNGELRWHRNGGAWIELGRAHLLLADAESPEPGSVDARLTRAIDALGSGLGRSPVNGRGWLLLAHALARREGWSPAALSALRLAFDTAPYEPSMVLPRLDLAFSAWPHLPSRDQVVAIRQIRLAWNQDAEALLAMAQRHQLVPVVRAALQADPAAFGDFEKRLERRARLPGP